MSQTALYSQEVSFVGGTGPANACAQPVHTLMVLTAIVILEFPTPIFFSFVRPAEFCKIVLQNLYLSIRQKSSFHKNFHSIMSILTRLLPFLEKFYTLYSSSCNEVTGPAEGSLLSAAVGSSVSSVQLLSRVRLFATP